MKTNDYYDSKKKFQELAELDESADYEVDCTFVGMDKESGKFVLMTASGCSCWDGYAELEYFDSLDAMESSLFAVERTYNPSLEGAKRLMAQAREAIAA